MSDPVKVWEKLWETLADGILYEKRKILNLPGNYFNFCCPMFS
jgi:hypothetical protein